MEISHQDVASGSLDNSIVWICDYRYTDFNNKPIRNVSPTRVMIIPVGSERVNYSKSYFIVVNEDGSVKKSKKIKLYDATGWRSYPGTPVNIFTTEQECVDRYTEQCNIIKASIDGWFATQQNKYNTIIKTL